jgi:hypothetical protein
MKNSTRLYLLVAILLTALAVSAYGVALAAPGFNLTSSTVGQLLFAVPTDPASSDLHSASAAVPGTEAPQVSETTEAIQFHEIETETPEASESPEIGTKIPEASGTPEPGDDREVVGAVSAMDAGSITVDGVAYNLADFSEVKGTIQVGDQVKLEFITNPDGTLTVREVRVANSSSGEQTGSSDSGGHSGSGGHDNGGDDRGSDD